MSSGLPGDTDRDGRDVLLVYCTPPGRPGTGPPAPLEGAVVLQPCSLVLTRAKFTPSLMDEETSHGLLETGPMPQRVSRLGYSDPKLSVSSEQPALPLKAQAREGSHMSQGGPRQKHDCHPSIAISDGIVSLPPPQSLSPLHPRSYCYDSGPNPWQESLSSQCCP